MSDKCKQCGCEIRDLSESGIAKAYYVDTGVWDFHTTQQCLRNQLAALKESTRWIPVEERLPEEDDFRCICVVADFWQPNGETFCESWREAVWIHGGWKAMDRRSTLGMKVTHWRKITLPKERNETC